MENQEENRLPSHFFRAILSKENARMKIPPDFVKGHGNTISEYAFLQVVHPSLSWKMGVQRCDDGRVWFVEGWKEFTEYYSIKFGHVLMFTYKGRSKFNVSIYDPSLMEIQYPVKADRSKVVGTEEEDETDGEVEEDDDEDCPQRLQKTREKSSAKKTSKKRSRRAASAWDRVLERAEAYESPNPFFTVRMLPKSLLCVPHSHSIVHFLGKENIKGVQFTVGENGRETWLIKFHIGPKPIYQVRLQKAGWGKFVKDNRLKDGDVCVFQLIDSIKMVYKVSIFRIADYYDDDDEEEDEDDECPPVNQSSWRQGRCCW